MRKEMFRKDQFIAYDEYINDSEFIICIDPGHGGILDGECQTPGKSFKHDWGVFCEGEFNRAISMQLSGRFLEHGLSHFFTTDSKIDVGLNVRTTRANNYVRKYPEKKHIFISIHGNAHSNQKANGYEIWTSPGQTKSDEYATILFNEAKYLNWKTRSDYSDGDPDKESRFYVLVHTKSPAVLLELGFYSNPLEAKKMMSPAFQKKIVDKIVSGILKIINT